MKNSIEDIISTILSSTSAETMQHSEENTSISEINHSTIKSQKFQKKIDVLKSFLPIVGEQSKEHLNFFIKALTIAKLISDMDEKE